MHTIIVTMQKAQAGDRDTIGGVPILLPDQQHPQCRICNARMILFFQFDIRPEFALPFQPGSHLLVFMCPHHNDASFVPDQADFPQLRPEYWDKDSGHYALILNRPPTPEQTGARHSPDGEDPFLQPRRLEFLATHEEVQSFGGFISGSSDFKVGGVPGWINFEVDLCCQCGGKMEFVCQVPENFGFPQMPDAPPQPDGFSLTEYGLLLGNQVYLLACRNQCDPRALIAVCDN